MVIHLVRLLLPSGALFKEPSPALREFTGSQIDGWAFWTHEGRWPDTERPARQRLMRGGHRRSVRHSSRHQHLRPDSAHLEEAADRIADDITDAAVALVREAADRLVGLVVHAEVHPM